MTIPAIDFNTAPDELLRKLALLDLADQARGADLDALAAFGELVFFVPMPAHVRQWMTEILDNKRVAITAPPESAKTTWMIILVCWWIGRHPWTSNIVVSAGADAAHKIAELVTKTIKTSERWKLAFPNVVPDDTLGWSRDGWTVKDTACAPERWAKLTATRKDPTLLAASVGSSNINGKRVSGILLLDDIHDFNSKDSDGITKATVEFFKAMALPRAKKQAHVVVVQTRWHVQDVIAYVKTLAHFRVFEHSAIICDPGQLYEQGRSYWPEQWTLDDLLGRVLELGSVLFGLVYQGNDQAAAGSTLKGEWLWDFPLLWFKREYARYFGADFAITTESVVGKSNRDPDRFAVAVVAHTGSLLALEDGYAGRVSQGEAEEKLWQMYDIYVPKMIYLETNAGGEGFYQNLMRRMLAEGKRLPLLGQKAVKNKGARINEMQPDFEFGRLRVSDGGSPFLKLFREEWLGFGQKRVHDDTLDAVYWAWRAAGFTLPTAPISDRRGRAKVVNPWNSLAGQHA